MPRPLLLRLAVAALLLSTLLTPLRRELFVGDETKYSEVVREMRTTGSWVLPTLEGTPFTHKPPLHFWLLDLCTFVFGLHSIWSFVLPSLLAFALLLWLMWRFGSPLAAFVCGTSLLVWGSAQSARMDVSFTALIALAIWLIVRFFDHDDFRALLGSAAALGVATLIKGPMAPVIALLFFTLEWHRRRRAPRGNYAPAIVALVAIPLLWFVPAMLMGGGTYTHEVLQKQLAGRAVGSWVHRSPPWYYLLHAPGFLFPWFAAAVVALVARWREERVNLNWILAVLVPYSLMSSKLDVYMMALVPPVALVIANAIETKWMRTANVVTAALLLVAGIAGMLLVPGRVKGPEHALAALPEVRGLFVVLIVAAAVALLISLRGALASTIALGFVPIAAFAYIALVLMPLVNEVASPSPLIRALDAQRVPAPSIALYTCPHLWSRDMPPSLDGVQYVSPSSLSRLHPAVIATSRAHASEIAPQLTGYAHVAELRMIGKWFDVYRR